jgi:hypothetical protein
VESILSEGMTGGILGSTGRLAAIEMGPLAIKDVVASYPGKESWVPALQLGQNGMLGNEVLERFDVVFDYPAGPQGNSWISVDFRDSEGPRSSGETRDVRNERGSPAPGISWEWRGFW